MRPDVHRFTVRLHDVAVRGRVLHGHAAVFDEHAVVEDGALERLSRAAFDAVLDDPATDVRALWNHDSRLVLGRQAAGTLRLDIDDRGLAYSVDLPATSYADDLRELVRRGDLDGASFGFVPGEVVRDVAPDGRRRTTHTSVSALVDVSPVTFPAYASASTALRARPTDTARPAGLRGQLILARHRARTTTEATRC